MKFKQYIHEKLITSKELQSQTRQSIQITQLSDLIAHAKALNKTLFNYCISADTPTEDGTDDTAFGVYDVIEIKGNKFKCKSRTSNEEFRANTAKKFYITI